MNTTANKLRVDLTPLNINGVVHIGAGSGDMAGFYHRLGVHKVMWVEKNPALYVSLYSNVMKYGMSQSVTNIEISDESSVDGKRVKFIDMWRSKAPFMELNTYDLINISCKDKQLEIIKSFDFLLDDFRAIVFGCPGGFESEEAMEKHLKSKGFNLAVFNDQERLFVKQGIFY